MKTLNKYSGVYAGVVVGTRDPLSKGRVRVSIPQIFGAASSTWADPMGGVNTPPVLGDRVNIQFLGGDVTRPVFSTYDVTRPWETSLEALQETVIALTDQVNALVAGYTRVQTGAVNLTFTSLSSYTQAVTFPAEFESAPKVFCNINSLAGVTARWDVRATNITTTGCDIFASSSDNSTDSWDGRQVQWAAILDGATP